MYNNPSGSITKVSIGPGILLIGPVGATPTIDMGYVKGEMTLTIDRQQEEIRQGSPQTIVAAMAKSEDVMVEFTGIEWNLDNLLRTLGDGATSVTSPNDFLRFGGTPNVTAYALRFQHKMANGGTLSFDLWKAIGDGTIAIKVGNDSNHEVPYKFKAIDPGTTDWAGAALTDGQKLARLTWTRV